MVKFRGRGRRTRRTVRKVARRCVHRHGRALDKSCFRALPGYRRGPSDLSQALTAFSRAIRARRRAAKLAPRFFDSAVVDREAREREERRQWMESWRPALNKAYGHDPDYRSPDDLALDLPPPLPSPRTRRAVERELAAGDLWMAVGREAMERYRRRRPHAIPSLSQVARMLDVAVQLGRLACGLDSDGREPPPAPKPRTDAEQALRKAYGLPLLEADHIQSTRIEADRNTVAVDPVGEDAI